MKYIFFILITLLHINAYQRKKTTKPTFNPTAYPTTTPTVEHSTRSPTVYDFKTMNYSGYIAVCVLVPYTVIGCTCIITFICCCKTYDKIDEDNNV